MMKYINKKAKKLIKYNLTEKTLQIYNIENIHFTTKNRLIVMAEKYGNYMKYE